MRSYRAPSNRELIFVFADNIFVLPLRELLTLRYKGLLPPSLRLYQQQKEILVQIAHKSLYSPSACGWQLNQTSQKQASLDLEFHFCLN